MKKIIKRHKIKFIIASVCLVIAVLAVNTAYRIVQSYGMCTAVNKWVIVASIAGGCVFETVVTFVKECYEYYN